MTFFCWDNIFRTLFSNRESSVDRYAGLRYDPNWRKVNEQTHTFAQRRNQEFQEFLEASLQGSGDPSEETSSNLWENQNEQKHLREKKKHTQNVQAVTFSVQDNGNNLQRQNKPPLPSSPYPYRGREKVNSHSVSGSHLDSHNRSPDQCNQDTNDHIKKHRNIPNRSEAIMSENEGDSNVYNPGEYYRGTSYPRDGHKQSWEQESASSGDSNNINSNMQHYVSQQVNNRKKSQMKLKPKEDFVEKNKFTLGVNTPKMGSYLHLHSSKKEELNLQMSICDANKEESIQTILEEAETDKQDPEDVWHKRAQRLKVCKNKSLQPERKRGIKLVKERPPQSSVQGPWEEQKQKKHMEKEKNLHFMEVGNHPQKTSEVLIIERSESITPSSNGDSSLRSPVSQTNQHAKREHPTLNLNINLNTSSELVPLVNQDHNQTTINLTSPNSVAQSSSAFKDCNVYRSHQLHNGPQLQDYNYPLESLSPKQQSQYFGYSLSVPALYHKHVQNQSSQSQFSNVLLSPQVHYQELEDAENSLRYHRIQQDMKRRQNHQATLGYPHLPQLPSLFQRVSQSSTTQFIDQMEQLYQETPRLAHTHPNKNPYSYTVLPPIQQHTAGSNFELSTRTAERNWAMMQRSNSDSYLAQLEKQKQLKQKTAYKAYTMKDYKNLKQEVTLGGLGPDYQTAQEKAQKVKRQKEYAQQVREQNKKMCSDPFTSLNKTTLSSENKNSVPRQKALEYAKSIRKPKITPKPRSTNQEPSKRNFFEHPQYLEDFDLSQIAMLEMLQRRHEEEKQAVAAFKALHVT
nr:PREDICTED: uncharacterized protein C11orf63 homolog [Latimeria chalumnae]|eukprot:XP_014341131.1 PREDICTED: uncharacterized protein C11orf63 homolog [Latimeria chalumnae]